MTRTMKRPDQIVFALGFLLIAATAVGVVQLRASIRLSPPGVRVVAEPTFDPQGGLVNSNSVPMPRQVEGYEYRALPVAFEVLGWLPKDTTYGQAEYINTNFFIQANVVLMGADRTSIHQPQYCLPGAGWTINEEKRVTVPMERPHPYDLEAKRMVLTAGKRLPDGTPLKAVFLYWFVADGQLSCEHSTRMWTIAADMLRTGTLQRWAYVSFFSTCLPGQEEATAERLVDFARRVVPEFQVTVGPRKTAAAGGDFSPGAGE